MTSERNLVISPVGDDSQHPTWLDEAARRQFDLAIIYYGSQPGAIAARPTITSSRADLSST